MANNDLLLLGAPFFAEAEEEEDAVVFNSIYDFEYRSEPIVTRLDRTSFEDYHTFRTTVGTLSNVLIAVGYRRRRGGPLNDAFVAVRIGRNGRANITIENEGNTVTMNNVSYATNNSPSVTNSTEFQRVYNSLDLGDTPYVTFKEVGR